MHNLPTKVATHFLHNSDVIRNSQKKSPTYFGYFCETICCQELVKTPNLVTILDTANRVNLPRIIRIVESQNRNCSNESQKFDRLESSVTRFGEISLLWHNFISLWAIFGIVLAFGKHLNQLWKFYMLLGKFSLL